MSTIKEDDKIRELYWDIHWYFVQLDNDLKKGEKGSHLGIEKESNLLSVDKRNEYQKKQDKAEDELYELLAKANRIEIRESFEGLDYVEHLKDIRLHYDVYDDVYDKDGKAQEKIIEYLWDEDIITQDEYIYNYFSLDPPYVKLGTKIPEGIRTICNESRLCFVHHQYNATIVLSRTVIETILKELCSKQGENYFSLKRLIFFARWNLLVTKRAYSVLKGIQSLGNRIVHGSKIADKKDAKQTLDDVLFLFEEIYFQD